jgi:hypothetical protein
MPLMHDAAPAGADKMIGAALAELVGHGALAMGRNVTPAASTPVRLFHLGADAIATGKGLAAAKAIGWIATVRNGAEVIGSVELADAPPSASTKEGLSPALRFSSFTSGPLHIGLSSCLVDCAARSGKKQVKVAVVRAPAVHLLALWTSDGGEDKLVPIAPAPPPLVAGTPIAAAKALQQLAPAAKSAVASDKARS